MKRHSAEVLQEYGPFEGVDAVHGVTFDRSLVWLASGHDLRGLVPSDGSQQRVLEVTANAGTAFDGRHLFQIAQDRIQKIDPENGAVLATIPAPNAGNISGMAWAEGSLWVGAYRDRRIHQVDPETGAVLRTIETQRYVTGVTWVDGELWHGTWEDGTSDITRIDPDSGAVEETIAMPAGTIVSGLEADGGDRFYCGGGPSGTLRAVRRPRRSA